MGSIDNETGLSEYEVELIKKLADQTEKLHRLYKDNANNEEG